MTETAAPPTTPQLAVSLPVAGQIVGREGQHRLVELARMSENAGAGSVVVVDHVVMGTRPDRYRWGPFRFPVDAPWLDPLVLLGAIAGATSRVRLATGILIAPLRPAALLAKMTATLDVLSGGRLDLGVATGWQPEEYEACGIDFAARSRILRDTIAACRALWGPSPASFESTTISFSDLWCEPKPVQPGGPPVFFAGTLTDVNVRRITKLGDGWIPIMGATDEDVAEGIATLHAAWREAGRDPAGLRVRAPLTMARGDDGSPDLDATLASARRLGEMGASEALIAPGAFVRDFEDASAWFRRLGTRWQALWT